MKQQDTADQTEPDTTEPVPPPRQLQHETGLNVGGPCTRCGLVYSRKTAYTPCFVEGDTLDTWRARNPEALDGADPGKTPVQP